VTIADELAIRAGMDPDWLLVLEQYLAGHRDYPAPFQPRSPYSP
jgi:hypothetical protein